MAGTDQQTLDDIRQIIDLLEQRIYELPDQATPSYRFLTRLLDLCRIAVKDLETDHVE